MNKITETFSQNLEKYVNEFIWRFCNFTKNELSLLGIFLEFCLKVSEEKSNCVFL